jgi:hypothetical protein
MCRVHRAPALQLFGVIRGRPPRAQQCNPVDCPIEQTTIVARVSHLADPRTSIDAAADPGRMIKGRVSKMMRIIDVAALLI